jgi:hypothetical protein
VGVSRESVLKRIGFGQKLFSRDQWKKAEKKADERGGEVASFLVKLGFITRSQLRGLERAVTFRIGRDEDKALGKVIVDSGYADATTVDDALKEQKSIYAKSGDLARICELLVRGGVLSESQHLAARKIHDIARTAKPPSDVE